MTELQISGALLLTVAAWILISLVVMDMIMVARFCLTGGHQKSERIFKYRSSSFWIVGALLRIVKLLDRREAFLRRFNIIVPVLQIIIWKGLLIFGFAFLYLAINWQIQDQPIADNNWEDFFSALWLSLTVSFRVALYDLVLANSMIFLVVNIQFYQGFLFYAFVCFYFVMLRQKAKRIQPRLYNLRHELGAHYSPFFLCEKLRRSYRTNDLLLILQDWERWADDLRIILSVHPQFIYSSAKREFKESFLTGLSVVLDATAALIVSSRARDDAIERQARWTFGAARRTLLETVEQVGLLPKEEKDAFQFRRDNEEQFADVNDEVLSAELIAEPEDCRSVTSKEKEMLEVWQFTYQSSLRALTEHLAVELPSWKYNASGC